MMRQLTFKDGVVGLLFSLVLLLLISGLLGSHLVFAYALVAWLGALAGLGFARSGEPRTWIAAIVVFVCLLLGMTGVLLNESVVVASVADTVLGFHPGTAALIYGVWVPGVFSLGVGFVLLFDRLIDTGKHDS